MKPMIAFGTYDKSRHPRFGVVIDGLRAHGHDVVELNRPLGLSTADRVRMLQQPWRVVLLAGRILARWARLTADAVAFRSRAGAPSVVLVGYLGHFDVLLARLLFPRAEIVLDHLISASGTAVDRGARGLRVVLLRQLDRFATGAADVVLTDTRENRERLPRPGKGVVVPIGAVDAWFDAAESADAVDSLDDDEPLRVIFFGMYTPLQGAPLIGDALAIADEAGTRLDVTMVGRGQDLKETRERAGAAGDRVRWLDWVEPHTLPALVASHHVSLGIFSDTEKGLSVVPNKVYEALAAGRVVVTSDSPPQRRELGDHLELVRPSDAAALAARLAELAHPAQFAAAMARARGGRSSARPEVVVRPLVEHLHEGERASRHSAPKGDNVPAAESA